MATTNPVRPQIEPVRRDAATTGIRRPIVTFGSLVFLLAASALFWRW